jgi:hypothetical protein
MSMNIKGSWKSVSHNANHFVLDGEATSFCGLITLNVIKDQKWEPPGDEFHTCGKCVTMGAVPKTECQCLACKQT